MSACTYSGHEWEVIGDGLPYPLQVWVCKECKKRVKAETSSLVSYYAERKKELAEK